MTHAPTPLKLRATTAICAVLALGTTPAWAQDAAPVLDVPAAAAPVQQPTIRLPDVAPAPPASAPTIVSQPLVQPAPPAPPPVAVTAEEPAPVRRTVARPAAAAPRTTPTVPVAAAAPAQTAPVVVPVAPVAPPAAIEPPAIAPAPATSRTVDIVDGDSALGAGALAALLVALGLGGTWAVLRARRRRHSGDYQTAYETQPAQVYAPVAAPTAPTAAREIGQEELVPAAAPAATVAMATGPVPQSRDERDALLNAMIDEAPSAENPFTSRKARLRRARIILQSREIDQERNATQPFDWRTYKSSTTTPTPAMPPRVTA